MFYAQLPIHNAKHAILQMFSSAINVIVVLEKIKVCVKIAFNPIVGYVGQTIELVKNVIKDMELKILLNVPSAQIIAILVKIMIIAQHAALAIIIFLEYVLNVMIRTVKIALMELRIVSPAR